MVELGRKRPEVVSLVALGPSKTNFFHEAALTGKQRGMADEVWVINKLGVVVKHDILFRMDDLSIAYKCNRKAYRGGNVPEGESVHDAYDDWLRKHDKIIMTSTAYPEYPTSVSFPLEEVVNLVGIPYFRTTPAYAVGFAMYLGVKQLRLYGCDYNYPTNVFQAESGRANLEYILGIAMERGMDVWIAPKSSLMDSITDPEEMFYGYKNPIEAVPRENGTHSYNVKERRDVGDKIRKKKIQTDKAKLQELMLDYKDDVVKELVVGDWITHEIIDNVKAEEKKAKKESEKVMKEIEEHENKIT